METGLLSGKILEKKNVSHNTIFLRLKVSNELKKDDISFFVYIYDANRNLKRPYTPIQWNENEICFIIKIYLRDGVSEYISKLSINDIVYISKPTLKLKYSNKYNNVLMICGGTGITPMLQILKHVENVEKITIISCNTTFNDTLINRDIINCDLKVWHVFSREKKICNSDKNYFINSDENNVFKTHITKEIIEHVTQSEKLKNFDFVYVCGPPGFMNAVSGDKTVDKSQGELTGILKELGYNSNQVYKF